MDKSIADAPLAAIKSMERKYGGDIWSRLSGSLRYARVKQARPYVGFPVDAALDVVGVGDIKSTCLLSALYTWRMSKVIYTFDTELASALADTTLSDDIPVDFLRRLPHGAIYISGTGDDWIDGFFAFVDYEQREDVDVLMLIVIGGDNPPLLLALTLTEDTIEGALDKYYHVEGIPAEIVTTVKSYFSEMLPLILYLVSDEPDITYHPAVRTRQRPRDTPSEVAISEVGVRIGAAFRRARESERTSSVSTGTGGAVRPHARRGHWHHFWTGPRDGERKLILRWVSPLIVHGDKLKGDDVTVVPVKEGKSDD